MLSRIFFHRCSSRIESYGGFVAYDGARQWRGVNLKIKDYHTGAGTQPARAGDASRTADSRTRSSKILTTQ